MTPTRRYSPVEWGAFVVAAAVTAFGVTMMIAWQTGLIELLRLGNPGPTLRFNTALMLALSGVALLCTIEGRSRAAVILAALAAALAAICAAERLFLPNLEIDAILFRPDERTSNLVGLGRAALGTSLGILGFAGAIVARHTLRYGGVIASILGIGVCTIAWVAINRYLLGGEPTVGWAATTGMALTTAIALFLLGAATIGVAFDQAGPVASAHWVAYPLAFAFAAASFMVWRELVDSEILHLQRQTNSIAAAARLQIRERLQSRLKAASRFARRWGSLDRDLYRKDGRRILDDFSGVLALNWIEPNYRIAWVCSNGNRDDLVGRMLPEGPRRIALQQARETGRFVFTPTVELLHGEPGFVGYVPTLDEHQRQSGYVAAVFRLEEFLDPIACDRRHAGFHLAVYERGRRIYPAGLQSRPERGDVTAVRHLELHGLDWHVRAWPTPATIADHKTHAPDLALAKGLLSAILLGAAVHLRQRANQRTLEAERNAKALQDSEQRFDLAVRALKDGVWEWRADVDGFYASPRYRELLGYPKSGEPISTSQWFARVHPDDLPRLRLSIDNHLQRRTPHDVVVRFHTLDDRWLWLRIRGEAAWDASGNPIRVAGAITDITAEREAERQLLQHVETIAQSNRALAEMAEAAEAAANAKSTFLRTMSHELRTPLNSIIGFSTGLLRHVASHQLDSHQRDRVERIAASGRHLLQLVNNVLDIAKAEVGDRAGDAEVIDVPQLFEELTAMTEPLLQCKRAITLTAVVDPQLPSPTLDRTKLKQILLNLLSNAVKFTDAGSIALTAAYDDDGWRFAVVDTGIGVAPGDQRRIFENFEQVQIPGRKVEGTGLGLPICATLAAALGGAITVKSRLGQGSAFTLFVRSAEEAAPAAAESDAAIDSADDLDNLSLASFNPSLPWPLAPSTPRRSPTPSNSL